jgi:hypothetical protein
VIVQKASQKIDAGEMDPKVANQLTALANARREALSQAKQAASQAVEAAK